MPQENISEYLKPIPISSDGFWFKSKFNFEQNYSDPLKRKSGWNFIYWNPEIIGKYGHSSWERVSSFLT